MPFRPVPTLPSKVENVSTVVDENDIMQVNHLYGALAKTIIAHVGKTDFLTSHKGERISWFVTSDLPEITSVIMKYHSVVVRVPAEGKVILYGVLNSHIAKTLAKKFANE